MSSINRNVIERSTASPPMSAGKDATKEKKRRRTLKTADTVGSVASAHGDGKKIKTELKLGKGEVSWVSFKS